MNRTARGRSGAVFLTLVLLATLFLMIDVSVADMSTIRQSRYGWHVNDNETVRYSLEVAAPGDVVVIQYAHAVREPIVRYDFLITEPLDAETLGHGGTPRAETVYHRVEGLTTADCCSGTTLHFTRPEGPPGEPAQEIALVWVYHYAEGTAVPTEPDARELFATRVQVAAGDRDTAETVPGWAVTTHKVLLGAAAVAGIGAVAAASVWLRAAAPRVAAPRHGDETEALVSLVIAGRAHLRTLRDLLAAALLFLLMTGAVVLTFFFLYLEDLVAGPGPHWHGIIRIGLLVVWGILILAIAMTLLNVQRNLVRWDARLDEDPLGL